MPLPNGLLALLSRLDDIVENVGKYLGLTLIEAMTLITLYQVFMRYVLTSRMRPSTDTEPDSRPRPTRRSTRIGPGVPYGEQMHQPRDETS